MASNPCALARAKLATFVDALGSNKLDKAITLIKGIRLFGTLTPLRKMSTDFTHFAAETVTRNTLAVTLDYFRSLAQATAHYAQSGEWTGSDAYRRIAFDLDKMGFQIRAKGFVGGVRAGIDLFRNAGIDPQLVDSQFELSNVRFKNIIARAVGELPFTTFESVTKPWAHMAFQTSLYQQAAVRALREGWHGAERTTRINALLESPTDQMAVQAVSDMMNSVFKNETAVGSAVSRAKLGLRHIGADKEDIPVSDQADPMTRGFRLNNPQANAALRRAAGGLSLAVESVLPYVKVPASIGMKGLVDYSPLGVFKVLMENLPEDSRIPGAAEMGLARSAAGTMLIAAGYEYAKRGFVQGEAPAAPGQREVNLVQHKSQNSVKIGGKWLNVGWMGPQAIPFLIGATAYNLTHHVQGAESEPTPSGLAGELVASGAKIMSEQSYMTGMKNVLDALESPGRRGSAFLESMLPLPQILGQASRAIDPVARNPQGFAQRLGAHVLPGYSTTLPERPDVFGNTVPLGSTNRGAAAAQAFLDPTRATDAVESPVASELARLNVGVSRPLPQLKLGHQTIERSPRDLAGQLQAYGPQLEQRLGHAISTPWYGQADDDARAAMLHRLILNFHTVENKAVQQDYLNTHR